MYRLIANKVDIKEHIILKLLQIDLMEFNSNILKSVKDRLSEKLNIDLDLETIDTHYNHLHTLFRYSYVKVGS